MDLFATPARGASDGPLIQWTSSGLYCAAGDFYIDPHRAVECAVVTHAHSDHARRGSQFYLTPRAGLGLLKVRLGKSIDARGREYGESFELGRARVSFHSAGHILGSAQVRVEVDGEVWVASGDYKRDPDPSCDPFEVVRCDTFITEATFGTPKYQWSKSIDYGREMYEWWQGNAARGENSLIFGYSLGKGQRILAELAPFADQTIWIHESMHALTECYRREGKVLAPTELLSDALKKLDASQSRPRGVLILAPPSVLTETWAEQIQPVRTAFASGWMQNQGQGRRPDQRYDHGFVLSDHADWNDLNQTIRETGARRVFVQHRSGALVRHLRTLGIDAHSADQLESSRYQRLPHKNGDLFG